MDINELTKLVIGSAYTVHNVLGPGFLEKVYENALLVELLEIGLSAKQQADIPVYYRGKNVGDFVADLVIEERLILELKAVQSLSKEHEVQLVNYLNATGIENGLLINFGPSVTVKRKFRRYEAVEDIR